MADTTVPVRARGLLAGDVAKALGVGVQTLHYYEREGLIPPPPRSESGYRLYTPELVDRVRFIRKAQALGLPLDEVRRILRLAEEGSSPCGRVQTALAAKLADVDRRLAELQTFRDELATLVARSSDLAAQGDGAQVCAIVEDAPAFAADTEPVVRLRRRPPGRP
ncbi:heavy metal-responsive transcriptional regulator [Nocardioides sp.]|uniref:heavy metal-responsive transcriptional regulator n=1 Tax=Nocardioides sp. TaxID=35761 RepID=UPI002ED8798C